MPPQSMHTWGLCLVGDDAADKVGLSGAQVGHQLVEIFLWGRMRGEVTTLLLYTTLREKGETPSCSLHSPASRTAPAPGRTMISCQSRSNGSGTGLADMPNGTCSFCCAREEPAASQVSVGKVLVRGAARSTELSSFLVHSSAGAHHPALSTLEVQCWHPHWLQTSSHQVFPCTSTFSCDRGPCPFSLRRRFSPRQGSSQAVALPVLVGKTSAPSVFPGCLPCLYRISLSRTSLGKGTPSHSFTPSWGSLSPQTFPQGL